MRPARRKCLHLCFYFLDRQLGLIHVKVQTWFPFPIQVYVNGQQWLTRRLGRHGVRYAKRNWMKMCNKEGAVLRVETVINDSEEFRIRRRVRRHGRSVMAWVPLRKGVAFLSRYRDICGQCNGR